jgi:hypothetical protein
MKLRNIYFRIDSDYIWGSGLSKEQYEKFDNEIQALFSEAGFEIIKSDIRNGCPYLVKEKTKLYSHPMSLSGCCDESHIEEIKEILSKGKTFKHYHTDIYDEIFDFDEKQELEYYQSKYNATIEKTLTDLFRTKRKNLFKNKFSIIKELASKIAVKTIPHTIETSDLYPSFQYVYEEYKQLVDKGLLIESTTAYGKMELCRTANKKELKA